MDLRLCIYEHFDLIVNSNINVKHYGEWKIQLDNNGFNTFKMNDSTHVQMFIVQKMWGFYKLLHVFY
jgi:hypothetical protein